MTYLGVIVCVVFIGFCYGVKMRNLLIVIVMLIGNNVMGDVITETKTFTSLTDVNTTLTFKPFDTTLGILEDMTLYLSGDIRNAVTIIGSGTLSFEDNLLPFGIHESVSTTKSNVYDYSRDLILKDVTSVPIIGTAFSRFEASQGYGEIKTTVTVVGRMEYVYDKIHSVPEPRFLMLIIVIFFILFVK